MDLSKLPKSKPLSAKKKESLNKILQNKELMDKIRRECAESALYSQAARNIQDRQVPSLKTVGNSSEQHVPSDQGIAREGEMKDWIEAKLGSDLTYQAIDQEYEQFLQSLRARLRIGSISRFTVKKEITKSKLPTEQKLTLTTKLEDIQERNKAIRRTLTRQYTKEFRQYKENAAKAESTNDEVIRRLSKKRVWGQEDKHSQDQQTEHTTKNRSEDQQREDEEKGGVSREPTAWKDLPAKAEFTSKEPQLEKEAEGLEHRTKKMREFVEKGQGTTVPGTGDYNYF